MEEQQTPPGVIRTLPLICGAFMVMIVLLVIFVRQERTVSEEQQGIDVMMVVGFATLVAGVFLAQFKLRPNNDGSGFRDVSLVAFQKNMLISLALIEFCALSGIFIVRTPNMSLIMPVASLVAIALFVFPTVLQYIRVIQE